MRLVRTARAAYGRRAAVNGFGKAVQIELQSVGTVESEHSYAAAAGASGQQKCNNSVTSLISESELLVKRLC